MPDNDGYRYWVDVEGNRRKTGDVTKGFETYLEDQGLLARWTRVEAGARDEPFWYLAPYHFVLVSLSPTVVILTPAEFGKVDRTNAWQLREKENRRSAGGRRRLVNAISCGTEVTFAAGMKWLSDDIPQPLTDIEFDARGEAVIPLPGGRLRLTRRGDACEVRRE